MSDAAQLGGAAIQAGTALAGNFITGSQNRKAAKKAYKRAKEFAQNAIQWRVQDAKAAGLHPLFALGAQTPAFVPGFEGGGTGIGSGIAEAGQAIGGAVSRLGGRAERREQELRLKLLEAQLGETDARTEAIRAETARQQQAAQSQISGAEQQLGVMNEMPSGVGSTGVRKSGALINEPIFVYESDHSGTRNKAFAKMGDFPGSGIIDLQASPQISHKKGNRGLQAGEHPGWKEYVMPNGMPILMPEADSFGEALEQLPMWMFPAVYKVNKQEYGPMWAEAIWDFLFEGITPDTSYIRGTIDDVKGVIRKFKE